MCGPSRSPRQSPNPPEPMEPADRPVSSAPATASGAIEPERAAPVVEDTLSYLCRELQEQKERIAELQSRVQLIEFSRAGLEREVKELRSVTSSLLGGIACSYMEVRNNKDAMNALKESNLSIAIASSSSQRWPEQPAQPEQGSKGKGKGKGEGKNK